MAPPWKTDLAFLYILLLTQTTWAQDPNISSGTCYYGPNQPADAGYIPCGNTAFGNVACCQAGSDCLDNNACFLYADGTTYVGTTYFAGCTDPTYKDPSCPDRGPYSDQQWSGMVYCNGTSDEWTLCDDTAADSTLPVLLPGCYCPENVDDRVVAFDAPSVIPAIMVLPAATGESISFFSGYSPNTVPTPTSTPTPTTTTTSSTSPTTTTSPTPVPTTTSTVTSTSSSLVTSTSSSASGTTVSMTSTTSSSSASSSSSSTPLPVVSKTGLSTGAKAGIGAGAALGGLILLGLIALLAICFRRRKRRRDEAAGSVHPSVATVPLTRDRFEAQRSPAWSGSGRMSELPGEEGNSSSYTSPESVQQSWSRPMSEVHGSGVPYQSMQNLRSQQSGSSGQFHQPYRRAEVPQTGVSGFGTSSSSSIPYRSGRQVEEGFYEMPAQLPGSTLPDRLYRSDH